MAMRFKRGIGLAAAGLLIQAGAALAQQTSRRPGKTEAGTASQHQEHRISTPKQGSTAARARVGAPPLEAMDAEQRAAYDRIAASPYGPNGPRMVLLQDSKLANAWAALGTTLASAGLPARWREMAVLIIAADWQADFQWNAHVEAARQAGVGEAAIEAIRSGAKLRGMSAEDQAIATYVRSLVHDRRVDDSTYKAARTLLGDRGLVQFTAFIGHYSNVAMTLVAHQVPLPAGQQSPFPGNRQAR